MSSCGSPCGCDTFVAYPPDAPQGLATWLKGGEATSRVQGKVGELRECGWDTSLVFRNLQTTRQSIVDIYKLNKNNLIWKVYR